jgi:hypothetical protein
VALWLVFSIELYVFQGRALVKGLLKTRVTNAGWDRWLSQLSGPSMRRCSLPLDFCDARPYTLTALALFALTIVKAMFVDIAELQQLYRIIVFFVLGICCYWWRGVITKLSMQGVDIMRTLRAVALIGGFVTAAVVVVAQTQLSSWPFFVEPRLTVTRNIPIPCRFR